MPIIKPKINYLCPECGSEDIWSDAVASWNVELQRWELATRYDFMSCSDCEYTSTLGFPSSPYVTDEVEEEESV